MIHRLVYHPLAICQAGAYLRKQHLPLSSFKEHYDRRRKRILEQRPQMTQY
jgi:hypothetical protein